MTWFCLVGRPRAIDYNSVTVTRPWFSRVYSGYCSKIFPLTKRFAAAGAAIEKSLPAPE
jgi:hypothetical protein